MATTTAERIAKAMGPTYVRANIWLGKTVALRHWPEVSRPSPNQKDLFFTVKMINAKRTQNVFYDVQSGSVSRAGWGGIAEVQAALDLVLTLSAVADAGMLQKAPETPMLPVEKTMAAPLLNDAAFAE